MTAVCAIIAVRNEAAYLPTLLNYLHNQSVEVVVLDNGSTDGSRDIADDHRDAPVIEVLDLPFDGTFNLSAQIDAKTRVIESLAHDWIIHQDADEILQSAKDETLSGLCDRAETRGFVGIDFDEFVFLPDTSDGYPHDAYLQYGARYYFFQPRANRLNRAFSRKRFKGFLASTGHNLVGVDNSELLGGQILRHYIALSGRHACEKYVGRIFNAEDLKRGMHQRRTGLTDAALQFDAEWPNLHRLSSPSSRNFDRSEPRREHYWQWRKP